MEKIREPAVAGMFYPARVEELENQLKKLFDAAGNVEKIENAFGIVAPHAGYAYSGKTAAFGYAATSSKKYETVIVISPSHREYFPGISVFAGDAYKTPLGIIPVNKEMRSKLTEETKSIFLGLEGHRTEHALEVQLPFLQYLFKDFSIVPIVIGDQGKVFVNELSEKLKDVVDDKTLVVASSDLSHFYTKQEADKLDSIVAKRIQEFDYENLQDDLEKGYCYACGGGGIVSLMEAAKLKGFNKAKVLHRSDSGDTTGDNSEVVGYLSAVIYE